MGTTRRWVDHQEMSSKYQGDIRGPSRDTGDPEGPALGVHWVWKSPGALTSFCMLAAGGCTLLLSLLCSESTRKVSFALRAAEGEGRPGAGAGGRAGAPTTAGPTRQPGIWGRLPGLHGDQRGAKEALLGRSTKGTGAGQGEARPPGMRPVSRWHRGVGHRAASLWDGSVTSPEPPALYLGPYYQPRVPTTSPTSPSPPQTPALLGSTWLGTGLGRNHPIPLGTSQAAPPGQ